MPSRQSIIQTTRPRRGSIVFTLRLGSADRSQRRGERQTLEGKSPKLSRISYTSSSKLASFRLISILRSLALSASRRGSCARITNQIDSKACANSVTSFGSSKELRGLISSRDEGNHQKGSPTGSVNCFGDRVSQCVAIHRLREHRRSGNHVVNPF